MSALLTAAIAAILIAACALSLTALTGLILHGPAPRREPCPPPRPLPLVLPCRATSIYGDPLPPSLWPAPDSGLLAAIRTEQ